MAVIFCVLSDFAAAERASRPVNEAHKLYTGDCRREALCQANFGETVNSEL